MLVMKGKVMVNLDKSYNCLEETYAVLEKTGTVDQGILKGQIAPAVLQTEHAAVIAKALYMPIISLDDSNAAANIHECLNQLHPAAFEFVFKKDTAAILSRWSI